MKKLFLITLILLFTGVKSFSQFIVEDPANLAQNIQTTVEVFNLGQTMNKLREIQDKIEKIKESVNWLKTTASVIQLIRLIEETICILRDLDLSLAIALDLGITQSCLEGFEYKVSITKLLLAIDQINSVLSEGTKMDQAQRWQIISIVLDNFTQSQLNFAAINKNIKKQIYAKQLEDKIENDKKNYTQSLIKYYE